MDKVNHFYPSSVKLSQPDSTSLFMTGHNYIHNYGSEDILLLML